MIKTILAWTALIAAWTAFGFMVGVTIAQAL